MLEQAQIKKQIASSYLDQLTITLLDSTPSTNDYLLTLSNLALTPFHAVLAKAQTQGRGRRGKTWLSSNQQNIYMSLCWQTDCKPSQLSGLSLATAVSILRSLKCYGIKNTNLQLKWPNDILFNQHKIGGILIETRPISNEKMAVVIGIGLNITLTAAQREQINQPTAALSDITDQPIDRNRLAGLLIDELISTLTVFKAQQLTCFIKEWMTHHAYQQQPVMIFKDEALHLTGTIVGITAQGELQIEDSNNQRHIIHSGEIKLRPATS
jgi:BirA family biotin operon repressor/biotin-[acetyl-CoA-carboxylase] ligase